MISRKIFHNIFSNLLFLLVSVGIALVMSPFIVHRLGDFYYGVWSIIGAITGYFSILDLGINRTIVRYVSKHDAKNDVERLNIFFNTVLTIFSLIGILIAVITIVLSFFLDNIVSLNEHSNLSKIVLLICGIDFAFSFPFGAIYAILIAKQEHTKANKINLINTIIKNVTIYASLSLYPNIVALSLCNVVFNIVRNYCILREVNKIAPEIKYNLLLFNYQEIGKILNYSIYSFAVSVSSRIINFTDEIVIGIFLKVSDVTYYVIAVNLISYFEKIILAGVNVFIPYISQLESWNERISIENTFLIGFRYTLLVTLYIYLIIIYFGKSFINLWMGDSYGEIAYPILVILATGKVFTLGQSMTMARLFGTSDHKFLGIMNISEAGFNLLLSLYLVKNYQLLGVAFGTLIPSAIINGLIFPIYTIKTFKINPIIFFNNSILKPIVIFSLSALLVTKIDFFINSYVVLIMWVLFTTISFFTLAYVILYRRWGCNSLYG